jgi:hypothetical protein
MCSGKLSATAFSLNKVLKNEVVVTRLLWTNAEDLERANWDRAAEDGLGRGHC